MIRRKRIKNISENDVYLELLFEISKGNNYAGKIGETTKREPSNICRQLAFLEKEKILSSKLEGKRKVFPFKKRVYSLTKKGKNKLEIGLKIKEKIEELNSLRKSK